jgi:hypothetical protein
MLVPVKMYSPLRVCRYCFGIIKTASEDYNIYYNSKLEALASLEGSTGLEIGALHILTSVL